VSLTLELEMIEFYAGVCLCFLRCCWRGGFGEVLCLLSGFHSWT